MKLIKKIIKLLYVRTWYSALIFVNKFVFINIIDEKKIPIIINNRNRLTFLRRLIDALEARGYKNIYILDNSSTFDPLLEYYKTCDYKIYFLNKNYGHLALWKSGIYKLFFSNYYIYTDSDVVPSPDCPDNFIGIMQKKMIEDKSIMKIGMGLRIFDLPDFFRNCMAVKEWESQFHIDYSKDKNYHLAQVDTTFALYRPFVTHGASGLKMLRTKYPYDALHLPWYNDSENITPEEEFYIKNSSTSTHWTGI